MNLWMNLFVYEWAFRLKSMIPLHKICKATSNWSIIHPIKISLSRNAVPKPQASFADMGRETGV